MNYGDARDFINSAGATQLPGLLRVAVRAAVRKGCFKDDEAMIRAIRMHIRYQRKEMESEK